METVFQACCKNERRMKTSARHLEQLLNRSLRAGHFQAQEFDTLTKMYAMLYSAYAEVAFLKIVHMPGGFLESEIEKIRGQRNLEDQWKLCLELCFKHISSDVNKGEVANKKQNMIRLLDQYVVQPLHLRNRIAHGQWVQCLNAECTRVNPEITAELESLDYITTWRYFKIFPIYAQCVIDLVVSPQHTHFRDYYPLMEKLKQLIQDTEGYTLEAKRRELLRKPIR